MELLAMMRTPSEPATLPGKVVFYYDKHNTATPYVTWWEDEQGGRCWGHYFYTEVPARQDFMQRCLHMLRMNGTLTFEETEHPARMVDNDGNVRNGKEV